MRRSHRIVLVVLIVLGIGAGCGLLLLYLSKEKERPATGGAAARATPGPRETPAPRRPLREGLTEEGQDSLDALLAAQDDPVGFSARLKQIASSGEYESVVILTHAMFDLPWVESLRPQDRYDRRMPKLAVEKSLDQLVGAREHDGLSSRYFRALAGRGDLEEAKEKLLRWTLDHREKLKWTGESFHFVSRKQ